MLPKSRHPDFIRVWFHPRIKSEDMLFGSMLCKQKSRSCERLQSSKKGVVNHALGRQFKQPGD